MPVLYINKPKGYTSFDVCNKLRHVFATTKIGHTGTLDPNATGVLVVLIDNATKANQFLTTDTKEYIAKVRIGVKTDTEDIDGTIIEEKDCVMPNSQEIIDCLSTFKGKQMQLPPMTSAIKVNGRKLYEYQRKNIQVDVPLREVDIYEIEYIDSDDISFTFKAKVSSGTYIRSLVRDICFKLKIIGTLEELTRTAVDDIKLEYCDELDEVVNRNYRLHDLIDILPSKFETINLEDSRLAEHGRRMKFNTNAYQVLVTSRNKCIAMYQKDGDEYKCVRGLL